MDDRVSRVSAYNISLLLGKGRQFLQVPMQTSERSKVEICFEMHRNTDIYPSVNSHLKAIK